ncbi:MAG: hypothetical protein LBF93_13025 [Zoogloeaceae bacterium]|jgi:hypothetical protein|nr:hypothetical protein [Zoogloeaceae bacterium]
MKASTLELLADAISDVGHWVWYDIDEEADVCQLEFSAAQLLNQDTIDEKARSATLALRFTGNSFLSFHDHGEENDWHLRLKNDEITLAIEHERLVFNRKKAIREIEAEFSRRIAIKERGEGEGKKTLAFYADAVAVVIGGDRFSVHDFDGEITEEQILKRSGLWWEYWQDYYKKRGKKNAYPKDYACDVTIPLRK